MMEKGKVWKGPVRDLTLTLDNGPMYGPFLNSSHIISMNWGQSLTIEGQLGGVWVNIMEGNLMTKPKQKSMGT